jgi:hypothetical protein
VSAAISLVGLLLAVSYLSDGAGGGLADLAFAAVIGVSSDWCAVRAR